MFAGSRLGHAGASGFTSRHQHPSWQLAGVCFSHFTTGPMGRGWVEAGDTGGAALGSFGNALHRGAEMEKSRSQRWPHVFPRSPSPRLSSRLPRAKPRARQLRLPSQPCMVQNTRKVDFIPKFIHVFKSRVHGNAGLAADGRCFKAKTVNLSYQEISAQQPTDDDIPSRNRNCHSPLPTLKTPLEPGE